LEWAKPIQPSTKPSPSIINGTITKFVLEYNFETKP